MDIGREVKLSDVIGYLLIRKLLQLLIKLKELMENKEVKDLEFWEQFQGEKDFTDIKIYVWKEYDVFKVFYQNVHTRIRDKVKTLDPETQEVINNPASQLNEKIFQRNLRDYLRSIFDVIKSKSFKT